MNRTRTWLAVAAATAVLAAGCGSTDARPSISNSAPPSPIAATPHGDRVGGNAVFAYTGFRDWVTDFGSRGVAIVTVTSVGPIRWNTADGGRPSETALHGPPAGSGNNGNGNTPFIGQLVSVEVVRPLTGRWLGSPDAATRGAYWQPGGRLGLDVQEVDEPVSFSFVPGQTAVAFLLPQQLDLGYDAPLPVEIGSLFPVDGNGRVETFDPSERITLDTIGKYLP